MAQTTSTFDEDDSYHLLLALLTPVALEDVAEESLGNLSHPAIALSTGPGLYSRDEVLASAGPHPTPGPLYSPQEVVALSNRALQHGSPNYSGLKEPLRSHLNLPALKFLLADFTDPWPLQGSTYGWPLDRDPAVHLSGVVWPNHDSALRNLGQVNDYVWDEVQLGAMYPLGSSPAGLSYPVSTVPLLTVPKPPHQTKVRVCGDMSFPDGASVNDGISPETYCGEPYKVRLPSIWDYLALVREVGLKDAVLAKVDLSRGYRQLPICPAD